MPIKLNLIVAACENRGIGVKGQLPWKLKNEMAYFTRMTSDVKDPNKKNAVIMGRKTWDSIPPKYKPLANRINVVLSRTVSDLGDKAIACSSLEDAVSILENPTYQDSIESVWVIGGSSVYKDAMESPYCSKIYYTNIKKHFDCDTFMPEFTNSFREIRVENIPSEIQEENGVQYEFKVYEKNI